MAARNIELGTVGFNLEANDSSLTASLAHLRQFGAAVNKASGDTADGADKIYSNMVRVERILSSAFDRVSALTDGLRKVGADESAIGRLTSQYDALARAMTKAARGLEAHEPVRASVGLGAATAQATRAIKDQSEALSLAEAKTNALVTAWERIQNAQSRFKIAGASDSELSKLQVAYNNLSHGVNNLSTNTVELRTAQRSFTQELGETTRGIRENLNVAGQAERQQTRLITASRNVQYLNARVMRSALPNSYAADNNSALSSFGAALQGGKQNEVLAAQQKLNDALMATRLAMAGAEKPTSALSLAMHDMSKAATLALGPLSGVGSRLNTMTSLLDSNTVQMALFVGGAVGMIAALYKLTTASVQATSAQQKFDALLTTSTGSATLVGDEYKYLYNFANKLGVGVKELVKPYSDFSSSARLAGMSMKEQRKIFEAIITTSAALRSSNEETGRMFLAVTQMISKTTVMSEEYKKQLGQLIPNVIGLGAAAEHTSTQGLMSMMKASTLISTEHLPKLSDMLLRVFGPAAILGAKTLTSDVNRLHNEFFETMKALDNVTHGSEIWQRAVIATTVALMYLKEHMQGVIQVIVAIVGAGAGVAFARLLMMLPAAIAAVEVAVIALSGGLTALRAAIMAIQTTTIVGWLVTLTGAVVGAAVAYKMFGDNAAAAAIAGDNINGKIKAWIEQQKSLGETQDQVQDRMKLQAQDRMQILGKQINDEEEAYKKLKNAQNPAPSSLAAPGLLGSKAKSASLSDDPLVLESKARLEALQSQKTELEGLLKAMSTLKIAPPPLVGAEGGKDGWFQKMAKDIRNAQAAMAEFEAFKTGGIAAQEMAKAVDKAVEAIAEIPKKNAKVGELVALLNKAGFAGKDLKDQFTAMFLAQEKARAGTHEWTKKLADQENATKKITSLWDELAIRERAAKGDIEGLAADKYAKAKKLADALKEMQNNLETLGRSQAFITQTLSDYAAKWKEVGALEDHVKAVDRVTAALERMGVKIGTDAQRLQARANQEIAIIREGVSLKILTEELGAAKIVEINADMYRKMTKGGDEFYKALHGMFGQLENSLTDALSGKGGAGAFQKVLAAMFQEVVGFMVRIAFVKPLMASLFGGLYSGISSQGNGLFGGALLSIGNMAGNLFGGLFGGVSAGAGAAINNPSAFIAGGRAGGGGVDAFKSYMVGEDGPEVLKMGPVSGTIIPNSGSRSGGVIYTDNTRNVWNIDARSDIASTILLIGKSQKVNNDKLQRELKVRLG